MREIIYRGKRSDNGEWVEGQLLYFKSSVGIEEFALIVESCEWDNSKEWFNLGKRARVIPETVGQYTGSTDKNGTNIFEGDIVEFYFFDKGHKNTKTMLIEWRDSGFCMRELFRDYRLADDFTIIDEKIFTYRNDVRNGVYTTNNVYFVEVIGNIHDNPELLGGD